MKLSKYQTSKTLNIIFIIAVLPVLCTVFVINKNMLGIIVGKYFWFYAFMTLLSAIATLVTIMRSEKKLHFEVSDMLILLFYSATVLITLYYTGRLTNRCILFIFLMIFYFYLRIFFSDKNNLIYSLCSIFFVITGLVEAVWGAMQLYGFTYSQHHLFKITGSFFNPGPYSGWLAMVFPMATFLFQLKIKNCKLKIVSQFITILGLLTVICILLILPAAMSRASWLAALGGSIFIVVMYGLQNKTVIDRLKKYKKRLVILSIAAIVLFAVAMTGLFLLKKDSASGRAFTWKIALQTIKENPMGVGLGNFGGSYGDAQAAYFASGAGTEREEHVAGGVEYAFNEYLQICIETGIIPFLIFLAFVFRVLYLGIRNKNYLPAGSLIALLIFASMSYPFNVLPFVIAFVFLSALCMVGSNDSERQEKKRFYPKLVVWAFLIIAPASIALCVNKICSMQDAYKKWNRTRALYSMNMYREAAEEYAVQYPYLQDEITFLFEYANSLSKSEQYEKSNEILRRTMQISCDPMLYNIMGKNCQALKEYECAEQSFRKAANLVPNRLYPHYLLAKLYHETGQKDKMEQEINIVMTKTPKVESKAVEEMREELKQLEMKNEKVLKGVNYPNACSGKVNEKVF